MYVFPETYQFKGINKPYSALLMLLLLSSCARTITFKNELLEEKTHEIASVDLKEHSLLSAAEVKQRTYPEPLATSPKVQKGSKALKAIAAAYKLNKIIKNKSILIKAENNQTTATKNTVGGILKILLGLVLIFLGLVFSILGFYGIYLLLLIGASSSVFVILFLGLLALILGIIILIKGIRDLVK